MLNPPEPGSPWQAHPATYRAAEIRLLAQWIVAGASGSVLGLSGAGRSNLLGFLCHRPEVWRTYVAAPTLPVILVPVDLGELPTNTLNDLYRVLLRACYERCSDFAADTQLLLTQLYQAYRTSTDAFLTQSALRELLRTLQMTGYRLVLVVDRFDSFCRLLTPDMAQALGALRDNFRDTLSYIVGVRQSLRYLESLELAADLQRLLTTQVCYLGPLNTQDALHLIQRRTQVSPTPPTAPEIEMMLTLTGGYPTLLKALCRWWLLTPELPALDQWPARLLALPAMQQRLQAIWAGLTQEEQLALTELQKGNLTARATPTPFQQQVLVVLPELAAKGLCHQSTEGWSVFGTLWGEYIAQVGGMSRGRIWLDTATQTFYHGPKVLDTLTPKEIDILTFLAKAPGVRHTYTDVIVQVWSDEENYHGVTNDSLFQAIKGLRRKIEPNPAQPVYIVNWRGKPEGGYVFFPEGRPI